MKKLTLHRVALVLVGLAAALVTVYAAHAAYTGPNRTVTTWIWQRLRCHYQAIYDPPGAGWWGCYLNLYYPPDASCPTNVASYFTPSDCGWPQPFCQTPGCVISGTSSIVSCQEGETGCRGVPQTVTHPEPTVSGSIGCGVPGSGGWCRGGAALSISGTEPLSGHSILAIEGTRNGQAFACPGASCSVPLVEGANEFTFWAVSTFGDTSELASLTWRIDSLPPTVSIEETGGMLGLDGWYVDGPVTLTARATDATSGVQAVEYRIDGAGWQPGASVELAADGTHLVEFLARDFAGNEGMLARTVRMDTVAPTSSFIDPPEGSTTTTAGVFIMHGISEDMISGVVAAEISLDGGRSWVFLEAVSGMWRYTWDTRHVANGTYTVLARAVDAAGNLESTARITVIVDNAAPRVDIPDRWPIWQPVEIKVLDQGIGVERVALTIHSSDYGDRRYEWSGQTVPREFVWDRRFGSVVAPPGSYEVTAEAWDRVGNHGSDTGLLVIPLPPTVTPTATATTTATLDERQDSAPAPLIADSASHSTSIPTTLNGRQDSALDEHQDSAPAAGWGTVIPPAIPPLQVRSSAPAAGSAPWWPLLTLAGFLASLGAIGIFDPRPPAWRRLASIRSETDSGARFREDRR